MAKSASQKQCRHTAVWSEATVHAIKNVGDAPTHTILIDIRY